MALDPEFMDDKLMDDDYHCISIKPSKIGNDRVVKTCSVQIETQEIYEIDEETNTYNRKVERDTQTDIFEQKKAGVADVNAEELGNWLEAIYPRLANILEQNSNSRTFDNYEVKNEDTFEANTLQYTLTTTFEFTDLGTGDDDEETGGDDTGSFQEYQDDIDEWGDMQSVSKKTKPSVADSSSMHSRAAQRSAIDEEFKALSFDVTSVDWSCNGSSIAVAYGKQNHPSMSFQGCVSIWGIFRRDLDHKKPNKNIEVGNCITCLKFHPSNPSILAGGSFIGEIYLWNVYNEDSEICNSRADEYYHRESITQLVWISQQQLGSLKYVFTLVSCSTDGKILIWNPENKLKYPSRGHLIAKKKKGQITLVGGTSLDVNCIDKNTFILGTEGGMIFKCNLQLTAFSEKLVATGNFDSLPKRLSWRKEAEEIMDTITNKVGLQQVLQEVERYCMDRSHKEVEPVHIFNAKPDIKILYSIPFSLNYEKQYGPNQAISCSPFQRKIFLSCSIDGSIKMYEINNHRSIAAFEPSTNEYIMDVCFSPIRPAVFAAIGTRGKPYIYDLTISKQAPAYILGEDSEEVKVTRTPGGVKISFNPKQRDFIAVGHMGGETKIYRLNQSLSNPKKNEINVLNEYLEDTEAE